MSEPGAVSIPIGVYVNQLINGFLFGIGMIAAAFVMKSLLHWGFCG